MNQYIDFYCMIPQHQSLCIRSLSKQPPFAPPYVPAASAYSIVSTHIDRSFLHLYANSTIRPFIPFSSFDTHSIKGLFLICLELDDRLNSFEFFYFQIWNIRDSSKKHDEDVRIILYISTYSNVTAIIIASTHYEQFRLPKIETFFE